MADDVEITPGTGAVVATDDVGGVHYQKVKLDVGGDGASTPVTGHVPVGIEPGANREVGGTLGALDAELEIDLSGAQVVTIAVTTSNLAGTVEFETYDGSTWGPSSFWLGSYDVAYAGVNPVAGTTWRKYVEGSRRLRLRVTAYTSGTSTWTLTAAPTGTLVIADSKRLAGANGIDVEVDDDAVGDGWTPSAALRATTAPHVYNGSTWDSLRGDNLGLHVSRQATAATATLANVASSASSVTLLALNAARKGASIHNDSTQVLYVKFGTTASATSYTVKMAADAHYEIPFGYTGRIDGIWASANGNARVTELT